MKAVLWTALYSTALFFMAARAQAACDWNNEIFKSHIDEKCQTEFENKLTNEQDKIYSRRMFKDWNLPADTEVHADNGYLEVVNEREQTYFQSQWLSRKPAILWINGVVFTDDSKDPSIYRMVERMFQKADGAKFARVNPVRTFLLGNEAYAAQVSPEQNLQFLYTVNHFTGSAQEILDSKDASGAVDLDTNAFSQFMTGFLSHKDKYQCKDHVLGKFETDLQGKHITIEQTGRTKFSVKGLLADATQAVQVDMKGRPVYSGEDALKKRVSYRDKFKHLKYRVRTYFDTPCQGRTNAKNADACKDAWNDWVEKNPAAKEKFDALVKAKGDSATFGREITCKELYNPGKGLEFSLENHDYRNCREFFASRIPLQGLRFTQDSAELKVCDAGAPCRPLSEADFAKKSDKAFADQSRAVNPQVMMHIRAEYREALKNAGLDADKICAAPTVPDAKCDHWDAASKVKPADRAALEAAYKAVQNPQEAEAARVGGQKVDELSTRMMGVMMLADCCEDNSKDAQGNTCSQRLSAKDVELKQADKLKDGHQAH